MRRRRRLHNKIKTPQQIAAYHQKDDAELKIEIITMGIQKRLEHFYGYAEDYQRLLTFIKIELGNAVDELKITENLVNSANLAAKSKTRMIKVKTAKKRTTK